MNHIEISPDQSICEDLGIKKRRKGKSKPLNRHTRKLTWIRFKNRVRSGYHAENDPNALFLTPGIFTETLYLKNKLDLQCILEK